MASPDASRRRFLQLAGGAGALGAALAACGGSDRKERPGTRSRGASDLAIAKYALTLEYLESDFYARAIASKLFEGPRLKLLEGFAQQETEHVDALERMVAKLGGRPDPRPRAAFPLRDTTTVIKLAQRLENLGAAAYLGQADIIRRTELLELVLSIHSVEARHAATLNRLLDKNVTPTGAFARGASMDQVIGVLRQFVVG